MANIDKLYTVNGISLQDKIGLYQGSVNLLTTGFEATLGSFYFHDNGTVYQKTDTGNTDWKKVVITTDDLVANSLDENGDMLFTLQDQESFNVSEIIKFYKNDTPTATEDSSAYLHDVTFNGGAALKTDNANFGSSSLRTYKTTQGASSDYISIPHSAIFEGLQYLTVDFRMSIQETLDANKTYIITTKKDSSTHYRSFEVRISSNGIFLEIWNGSWHNYVGYDFTPSYNTWKHYAIVYDGTQSNYEDKVKIYEDGTLLTYNSSKTSVGATYPTTTIATSAPLYIGGWVGTTSTEYNFPGYLDEFRISNVKRWTTSFTPAIEPYINDTYTLLLLHLDCSKIDVKLTPIVNIPEPYADSHATNKKYVDDAASLQGGYTRGKDVNGDAKCVIDTDGTITYYDFYEAAKLFQIDNPDNVQAIVVNSALGSKQTHTLTYNNDSGYFPSIILDVETLNKSVFHPANVSVGYIQITDNPTEIGGLTQCTIDFRAKFIPSGYNRNFCQKNSTFKLYVSTSQFILEFGSSNFAYFSISSFDWAHYAIVYDGTGATDADKVKMYVNGTAQTLSFSGTIPTSLANNNNALSFTQYDDCTVWLEEFRISNVKRWTTNFTPQNTPYNVSSGNDENTIILLHPDIQNINTGNIRLRTIRDPEETTDAANKQYVDKMVTNSNLVKLINKTGSDSVKGSIVKLSTSYDTSFDIAGADSDMPIGVCFQDNIPDGQYAFVQIFGIADVLLKDSTSSTRGDWVGVSDTAGRAFSQNSVPSTTPDRHIGHSLESKSSGTNVFVKVLLHFR